MYRILLLLDTTSNRHQLEEYLAGQYELVLPGPGDDLDLPFDVGIISGRSLERLWDEVLARKAQEQPAFLPFILLSSRHEITLGARNLWQAIDDMVIMPVDKAELQARIEVLWRARDLSLQLKVRNDDLEAFIQAMTHDLRAPSRVAASFAQALLEDYGPALPEEAQHYIERIVAATQHEQELLNQLLAFARLGSQIQLQPVALQTLLARCLADLRDDLQATGATVVAEGPLPIVQADPHLLATALNNLISNAVKYVPPGRTPRIRIEVDRLEHSDCIQVHDNGIGIAPADHKRIFAPFVRLFGVEQYPGVGLGLASVRKAAELMGGRVGVESTPGEGSTFWLELKRDGHTA